MIVERTLKDFSFSCLPRYQGFEGAYNVWQCRAGACSCRIFTNGQQNMNVVGHNCVFFYFYARITSFKCSDVLLCYCSNRRQYDFGRSKPLPYGNMWENRFSLFGADRYEIYPVLRIIIFLKSRGDAFWFVHKMIPIWSVGFADTLTFCRAKYFILQSNTSLPKGNFTLTKGQNFTATNGSLQRFCGYFCISSRIYFRGGADFFDHHDPSFGELIAHRVGIYLFNLAA